MLRSFSAASASLGPHVLEEDRAMEGDSCRTALGAEETEVEWLTNDCSKSLNKYEPSMFVGVRLR